MARITLPRKRPPDGTPRLPDFLTIEEAAKILRIGRTTAYALARQYETSGGEAGIPVVRVGKQLRVAASVLERWCCSKPTVPQDGG